MKRSISSNNKSINFPSTLKTLTLNNSMKSSKQFDPWLITWKKEKIQFKLKCKSKKITLTTPGSSKGNSNLWTKLSKILTAVCSKYTEKFKKQVKFLKLKITNLTTSWSFLIWCWQSLSYTWESIFKTKKKIWWRWTRIWKKKYSSRSDNCRKLLFLVISNTQNWLKCLTTYNNWIWFWYPW